MPVRVEQSQILSQAVVCLQIRRNKPEPYVFIYFGMCSILNNSFSAFSHSLHCAAAQLCWLLSWLLCLQRCFSLHFSDGTGFIRIPVWNTPESYDAFPGHFWAVWWTSDRSWCICSLWVRQSPTHQTPIACVSLNNKWLLEVTDMFPLSSVCRPDLACSENTTARAGNSTCIWLCWKLRDAKRPRIIKQPSQICFYSGVPI